MLNIIVGVICMAFGLFRKAIAAYVSLIAVGLAVIIYAVYNLLFAIP